MKLTRKLIVCLLAVMLMAAVSVPAFAVGADLSKDLILAPTAGAAVTDDVEDPDAETSSKDGDVTAPGASDDGKAEDISAPADGETTGALTEAPSAAAANSNYKIGLFVTDGEGNQVQSGGFLSCMGGVNLFINHAYIISAKYYDASGKIFETTDRLILGVDTDSEYLRVDGNTIYVDPAPKPFFFTLRLYDPTAESGETTYPLDIRQFKIEFSDILIAAVGLYVIVCAIRGKGSLFNDEYIKDDKKAQFKKLMRIICIVIGIVFLAAAALAICFSYIDWVGTVRYVLFGVGIAGLIAMIVVNNVFTDKEKRAKAYQTPGGGSSHASSSAFEFDGSEPTLDEVLADIEKEKKDGE